MRALLRQVPAGWPDQAAALELDEGSTAVVVAVLAALAGRHPAVGERAAAVAEAEAIVRDHRRRMRDFSRRRIARATMPPRARPEPRHAA